ncbi:hypothetical protein E2986_13768 [Frieseomelitta varia]|uniref:Fatty acyl-CoA reductase n=1 Tax=Frieseomelitta varia TaxID=561572 RepID=A0A833RBZ2_9HYME|nr:hypothetical protein E2986_13768 [Frieseomelitta varia]
MKEYLMEFEKGDCTMDKTNTEINKKLSQSDSIEEFYASTVILLTGATGFVGKYLLEKFMRIRQINAMNNAFESIKAEHGSSIFSKLHPVEGDVNLPDLGLSLEDRLMLIDKVNIVFHIAATLNFNQPLDDAIDTNTKGTSRVIDLCKLLKHVISYIHVSTAYKETILKTHPNTYTFSKNLAEQIVFNDCKSFPSAVVRPSIIGASLEQPCPGWLDNVQGITAVSLQIGKGNIKALPVKKDAKLDLVPVDYVVDTVLCAAWHVTLHRDNEVYNCTSNADPLRWDQLINIYLKCSVETPMNDVLWYPYSKMIDNEIVYGILNMFLNVLPAFVMDIFLKVRGKKPIMMKINKRFNKLLTTLIYFTMREWTFHRDNVCKMAEDIKVLKDSSKVNLDLRNMD